MKRIIHKIRLQPPEMRIMIAVIAALVLTSVIGAFWISTITSGPVQEEKTDTTPGPLSSLISNIKDTVTSSRTQNPTPTASQNNVQVIDAGDTSTAHDETNPYQGAE